MLCTNQHYFRSKNPLPVCFWFLAGLMKRLSIFPGFFFFYRSQLSVPYIRIRSIYLLSRRNAEQEVNSPRPRSTNFEQLTAGRSRDQLDQLSSGRSREQLSSGRSQLSSREQLDEFGVITPRRLDSLSMYQMLSAVSF